MDIGTDVLHSLPPHPPDERDGRLGREALVLPLHTDHPTEARDPLAVHGRHRRLDRADGLRVEAPPHDPVQPRLAGAGRARGEEDEAVPELEARGRPAADELVQAIVVEDVAELVGVLGLKRDEDETLRRDDRRVYGRRAQAPARRPDSMAPSINPAQPLAKSLPAISTAPSGRCISAW
jgi:hypothetical protein